MNRREFIGVLLATLSACSAPGTTGTLPRLTPGISLGLTPTRTAPSATPTFAIPTGTPTTAPSPTSTATAVPTSAASPTQCVLTPVVAPTNTVAQGYGSLLDLSTGLHATGTPPKDFDFASYRLKVTGKVDQPLSLSFDDLRCMPSVTSIEKLICPGFFEDDLYWTGVTFQYLLGLASMRESAQYIRLVAADGLKLNFDRVSLLNKRNFLGYQIDFSRRPLGDLNTDQPLPIRNGFPLRAVIPQNPGNRWVKWLVELQVN